ncbi:MAG: MFS transporter [Betaproteobacteria bacterium]|nr:MFS transporter [Betaproteobacteria bacterium]
MSRFPALEHPEFRRYFIGQAIALIGGFAHNVGMAWLAYRLTGSVALLGVVGFAQLSPALLVSPFAGLLADRYPRRVMLIGLLGSVALTGLLLAALTAAGWMNPALLVIFAFVRGLLFAIEIPIRHAFLVDLIEDRAVLPNAVALHSSALNTARFIGPAIGGVLIGWAGEAACFLLHPCLLCATLYQLVRIRTVSRDAARPKGSFGQQFIEGWRCAFDDPVIARMLIGVFALGFGVGPYAHLMPAAVAALHGAHPELVGLFLSSAGVGAMMAAITLAVRRGSRNLQVIAVAGNLSAAVGLAVFTRTDLLALAMGAMVLVGLGTIAQAVSTNVTIQQRVDDDKRGRVMAIYTAMFIGATPLGSLCFGQLGAWIGAPGALLAGAAFGLIGAALTAWRQRA